MSLNLFYLNYAQADFNKDSKYIAKIDQLQKQISVDNSKLSKIEQELKSLDHQISEQATVINNQNEVIKKIANAKLNLQYKKSQQIDNLGLQQKQLINQLKTTYVIHRNNNLQKLSCSNNISQLNRMMNYLNSYNTQSIKIITDIKTALVKIEELDANLNFLNSEQQQYKQKLIVNLNNLKNLQANNLQLKQNLTNSLNNGQASLSYYRDLDAKFNAALAKNLNTDPNEKINLASLFARAKGKLMLPVAGAIDPDFKNDNNKQAIFIKTAEGQKVKAVFKGQVVFSDWLRGFGYLTIIDHQDGYMSLYGHNQTLLKKTGDIISAGEAIALTGASGGVTEPGLYFEIRHNGNTINPLAWLKTDVNLNRIG